MVRSLRRVHEQVGRLRLVVQEPMMALNGVSRSEENKPRMARRLRRVQKQTDRLRFVVQEPMMTLDDMSISEENEPRMARSLRWPRSRWTTMG